MNEYWYEQYKKGLRVKCRLSERNFSKKWFTGTIIYSCYYDPRAILELSIKRDDDILGAGYEGYWRVLIDYYQRDYIKLLNMDWDEKDNNKEMVHENRVV